MSLVPTIYSSDDPGAPQISGTVGSLISVLRAVLVNGYGTAPNAKPGLGWTEDFTATNKAVFRNNPVSGTGYRLRVDDTQARFGRLRAYATMSTVDAGTGPTPTTGQRSSGCIWPKSTTADAAARAWWLIGNERCFYLFVATSADYPFLHQAVAYFAGDVLTIKPGDAHHFMVSASELVSFSGDAYQAHSNLFNCTAALSQSPDVTSCAAFVARAHLGSGSAVPVNHTSPKAASTFYGGTGFAFPYPLNFGLLWERALVNEAANTPRGFMPGIIVPLHPQPLSDRQEVTDLPAMPTGVKWVAKSFAGIAPPYWKAYPGQVLFELGHAWQ